MAVDINKVRAGITEAAERMGMDYDDLADMVPEVLEDCKEKAAQLKTAIEGGDAAAVKAIAHDLKGSTSNYGIDEASVFAKSIEDNHANPNMADQEAFATIIDDIIDLDLP